MSRLNPELYDAYKLEAERLRRAAIADFGQNFGHHLRRFAQTLAERIRHRFIAFLATQTTALRNKPACPTAYLHLVIGRQIDPAVRQWIARHTDALIAGQLGAHAGTTTIRIDGAPSDHWFPASASDAGRRPTTIHADLQVGACSMSRTQKGALIAGLYAFFGEAFGELAETSRIVIREVPAQDCFPYRVRPGT